MHSFHYKRAKAYLNKILIFNTKKKFNNILLLLYTHFYKQSEASFSIFKVF